MTQSIRDVTKSCKLHTHLSTSKNLHFILAEMRDWLVLTGDFLLAEVPYNPKGASKVDTSYRCLAAVIHRLDKLVAESPALPLIGRRLWRAGK